MKKYIVILVSLLLLAYLVYLFVTKVNLNSKYQIGERVDSLNGVIVYYNGGVGNNSGRNISTDNYNLGIKYQCVEFVKRYYYEHLGHKMPDSYGNAKDFFDKDIPDGELNKKRNLIQFTNSSKAKPKADDLIIFDATAFNKYGHVAIISNVNNNELEIIQQNPGPFGASREIIPIEQVQGKWIIKHEKVLGRLRMNSENEFEK